MEAGEEAVEGTVEEAVDELGLQSQSATELGGDSPAPVPSAPPVTGMGRPSQVSRPLRSPWMSSECGRNPLRSWAAIRTLQRHPRRRSPEPEGLR